MHELYECNCGPCVYAPPANESFSTAYEFMKTTKPTNQQNSSLDDAVKRALREPLTNLGFLLGCAILANALTEESEERNDSSGDYIDRVMENAKAWFVASMEAEVYPMDDD